MGNICPCPKRRSKTALVYDVHYETFEIEDNIGESSPKGVFNEENKNILTEEIQGTAEVLTQYKDQPMSNTNLNLQIVNCDSTYKSYRNKDNSQYRIENKKHELGNYLSAIEYKRAYSVYNSFEASKKEIKPKPIKMKYNPDDYRFLSYADNFKVKKIDSIKEQQFNIDKCSRSSFFIFDITANLYVDDTEDCMIFVAPCYSTIFLRNCKNIRLVAATKQFRTYNCHDCSFSLYCKSQPVIESSNCLKFTSFAAPGYPLLEKQFEKMKFEPWNNHWSEIHNFTKKAGERNHSLFATIDSFELFDWKRAFFEAELYMNELSGIIPFISGEMECKCYKEVIVIFEKNVTDNDIRNVITKLRILKAFKGYIQGEGRGAQVVLALDVGETDPSFLYKYGKVITTETEIYVWKQRCFQRFSDYR